MTQAAKRATIPAKSFAPIYVGETSSHYNRNDTATMTRYSEFVQIGNNIRPPSIKVGTKKSKE